MAKVRDRLPVHRSPPPLTQSLSGLAALREQLPPGSSVEPPDTNAAAVAPPQPGLIARAAKLVLRRERKGHAGKTATRIEGLVGTHDELNETLRELKRALGCGATVDGKDILVQGDQIERLAAHLKSHGARKIVIGT